MVNGEIVWDVAKGCRVSRRGSVWKTEVHSLRLPLVLPSRFSGDLIATRQHRGFVRAAEASPLDPVSVLSVWQ